MQRNSQQDQDGVVWVPAAIPLGSAGLDLRTPTAPGSLTKLINARFRDERTLDRRNGYTGTLLQDGSDFAAGTNSPEGWLYGHGQTLEGLDEQSHYPQPRRARGVFDHYGSNIVWTGDRLLVSRADGMALGAHEHWGRGSGSLAYGIPAFLPVQTDSTPPDVISGSHVETCLTETLRVYVADNSEDMLEAWVVDRATGAVIDHSVIQDGTNIIEPRVISSGGTPCALFLDGDILYISHWTGVTWTAPSLIADNCDSHNVAEVPGGFILVWREIGGRVKAGRYLGYAIDQTDFDFGTNITPADDYTTGPLAIAVAPDESFGMLFEMAAPYGTGLYFELYGASAGYLMEHVVDATVGPYDGGLTLCFRRQLDETGRYPFVIHAGNGDLYTRIVEFEREEYSPGLYQYVAVQTTTRYRTHVHSKSFRVGDEVFCWLRARNSQTAYLTAGASGLVCGIADREEAPSRAVNNMSRCIPMVYQDPLDEYAFTWARPYTTSRTVTVDDETESFEETYARAGNARTGDMQFMPDFCAVQYGEGVYVAGSLVRCWDGIEFGDAGFHDYPTQDAIAQSDSGGSLTAEGAYYYRVYAVRYNKRGERFQSPAITYGVSLTDTNDTAHLTIFTIPCTNHDDVVFEVYRTEAGGTTFYLDGVVANSFDAATVTYDSTLADSTLRTKMGDSHAPGIGVPAELEEMGPLGCSVLVSMGDRLWGCGGQVPAGVVQFSKLKEPGEGAGFDPLAGTQQIDISGGAVTSMAAFGEAKVFFQESGLQVVAADGPDNYGVGSFGVPQMILSDGAINHAGTLTTPLGPVFWGADGPRLLAGNFQVEQICAPVRDLSATLEPTGVQVDLARQEVVWYTADGTALLWNFRQVESKFGQLTSIGRWAQWTGIQIAGASSTALVTTDGRVLHEDQDANGDDGVPFEYAGATGYLAPQSILGGHTHVRMVGVAGEYLGPHDLRLRVYYDGSPLWTDEWEWDPLESTGLQSGEELGDLTAAQLDALGLVDVSGQYATHIRTSQHTCRHFRVEWSDIASFAPTYRLHELTLELGSKGGLGRVPVNTFRS